MKVSLERRARLACLFAGAAWGLFWIPLRALEEAGLNGLWITVFFYLVPTICLVPAALWRWKHIKAGGARLQITSLLAGGALLLYSMAIVYTDVVRAMLLFYLTPVWATLLARLALGEAITLTRLIGMLLAIAGMLTIFGLGVRFPVPENTGDWLGAGAGFLWAIAAVSIRMGQSLSAIELTLGYFQWSLILSGVAALLLAPEHMPSVDAVLPAMPLVLVFTAFLVLPGTYASLWGPKFLSPGVVGLLFMTEIVVGVITVALLAGEPFGLREMIGVALISSGSMVEPLLSMHRARSGYVA